MPISEKAPARSMGIVSSDCNASKAGGTWNSMSATSRSGTATFCEGSSASRPCEIFLIFDKFDELVVNARNLGDAKAREHAYIEAQKILLQEDAAIVPLYYEPIMALVRPRVKGLELNPVDQLFIKKVTLSG